MKNILKYIMLAAVALMATACQEGLDQLSDGDQGCVTLNIKMMEQQTRFTAPEELRVRVFDTKGTDVKTDDVLVRIFTEEDEIPNEIYLIEGNYRITVEGRDKAHTEVFKESDANPKAKLYYKGEATLGVEAGATTQANVECYPQNVRVGVSLDESKGENAKLQDVKISLAAVTLAGDEPYTSTDFTEATKAGVKKLDFGGTGDESFTGTSYGFFLLADGVTKGNIAWVATGNHVDDKETADNTADDVITPFDKAGQFEVEPGKAYKVNFVFQKAPNGAVTVEIKVEQLVEVIENEFGFKPQPEFSSTQWLVKDVNAYKNEESVVLYCEAINPLESISIKIDDDTETEVWSKTSNITANGISCTKENESGTKIKIELAKTFFSSLPGGKRCVTFEATDNQGGTGEQNVEFYMPGWVQDKTSLDKWTNVAKFAATVTDVANPTVKFQYRIKGSANNWITLDASTSDGYIYEAACDPWEEAVNVKGHKIYKPKRDVGVYAGNTYEYQMLVNDVVKSFDGTTEIFECSLTTGQTIPYATFEDTSLSCWGQSNSNAPFWGSGNNNYKKDLCTQDTYAGMQGSYVAKLKSSETLGMLAAGNVFTGTFSMSGFSGTVSFGVEYDWDARPTAMKVKVWHKIGNVTTTKYASTIPKGSPDQASIYCAIIDWGSQHKVTSGDAEPTGVWSPEDGVNAGLSTGKIIGYGVVYPTGTTVGSSMEEITIPIQYYNKTAKPTGKYSLIIAAATSRYGDYMNGCNDNVMYVDDFQWVY